MTWENDPKFWLALDDFTHTAWTPMLDLLNVLHEHTETLPFQAKAFLFGGFGKFVMTYKKSRDELNSPENSFYLAMNAIAQDSRMKRLHEMTAQQMVDNKVAQFKEANE
tara:strand:- start:3461 stop:3787 length:327 start_codon:yes stop_codon:yes gene_type:complete